MKVKSNSWHYKRYKRWEGWKRRTKPSYQPRTTLDLCHYMRVILFWYSLRWPFQRRWFGRMPPLAALSLVLGLASIGLLLFDLTKVSNWSEVGIFTGAAVGGLVLTVGIVFAIVYAFDEKKLHVVIKESDTFKLTKTYVKAKKSRVCPIIKVED